MTVTDCHSVVFRMRPSTPTVVWPLFLAGSIVGLTPTTAVIGSSSNNAVCWYMVHRFTCTTTFANSASRPADYYGSDVITTKFLGRMRNFPRSVGAKRMIFYFSLLFHRTATNQLSLTGSVLSPQSLLHREDIWSIQQHGK